MAESDSRVRPHPHSHRQAERTLVRTEPLAQRPAQTTTLAGIGVSSEFFVFLKAGRTTSCAIQPNPTTAYRIFFESLLSPNRAIVSSSPLDANYGPVFHPP